VGPKEVYMKSRTIALLGTVAASALCALGDVAAAGSQAPVDPLYQGLPASEPGAVRLGVRDRADVTLQVSVKRKTMRCDEFEASLEVLQAGRTHATSHDCIGSDNRGALTELVVGQGVARHYYRITFEYSPAERTVTYSIQRAAGSDLIESQRVVVDLGPAS
jgi:hypothetical protein